MKKGILERKLKIYYSDVNLESYKDIFVEGIESYTGDDFCKVLDIGCGIGSLAESVKSLNIDVYGLEGSEYGYKKCKEKGFKCKQFILEKKNSLPFKNGEFSLVVMNQVLEHLDRETGEYYIKEIIRVIEKGGVGIIKSPSVYSRIWKTDPNHVYCWKPNELSQQVSKYLGDDSIVRLRRVPLEPWMMFKYNENIIGVWHKYNKYPILKKIFHITMKIFDLLVYKISKSDRLLASSDITFTKIS